MSTIIKNARRSISRGQQVIMHRHQADNNLSLNKQTVMKPLWNSWTPGSLFSFVLFRDQWNMRSLCNYVTVHQQWFAHCDCGRDPHFSYEIIVIHLILPLTWYISCLSFQLLQKQLPQLCYCLIGHKHHLWFLGHLVFILGKITLGPLDKWISTSNQPLINDASRL